MKTVITKDALKGMLAFLTDNNMDAIQIYKPANITLISGKETPTSSQGYVINHSFKFTKESNNLGEFECIRLAKGEMLHLEKQLTTFVFADHIKNAILIITAYSKDTALLQARFVVPNFDTYNFEYVDTIHESKIALLNIKP